LEHCGAEIINRWVAHAEIDSIFSRYDVAVVPSTEASQSGVIATAHGHGLPAIVTPVGALPDQVDRGETGLVASSISAAAIAAEMRRYLLDPHLRKTLQHQVFARQDALSMTRFVDELLALH
jgi:glycosyltransferase involved in cell wall biosynthesis